MRVNLEVRIREKNYKKLWVCGRKEKDNNRYNSHISRVFIFFNVCV